MHVRVIISNEQNAFQITNLAVRLRSDVSNCPVINYERSPQLVDG